MLRILGAWNLPPRTILLLAAALALLSAGFLFNLVAAATGFRLLEWAGIGLVSGGAVCGVAAAARAARPPDP